MASFLGNYYTRGSYPEEKLERAIKSVIAQSYHNFELVIIADGCEKTVDVSSKFTGIDHRITCKKISKQPMFSGVIRNTGIDISTGDIIIYLDSDDFFGPGHIDSIVSKIGENQWVWFDDFVYDTKQQAFTRRQCYINQAFKHGTSNIAHRKISGISWPVITKYGYDDAMFIRELRRKAPKYEKIEAGQYYVCHIPKNLSGIKEYDV